MSQTVTYVGWGGKTLTIPADFDLGVGTRRDVPDYGLRRAIWEGAIGYATGFRKSAILYYVLTRTLSPRVRRWAMRREGTDFTQEGIPVVSLTRPRVSR